MNFNFVDFMDVLTSANHSQILYRALHKFYIEPRILWLYVKFVSDSLMLTHPSM